MINSVNRLNFMNRTLIYFGIAILLLGFSACSTIRLQQSQISEDKKSNLPQNIQTAEEDFDLSKETSCIISVNDDSGTYFIGKEPIAEAKLTEKIVELMKDKTPEKRIVFIESAVGVEYRTIVKLLNSIRKADIDKAGLVAYKNKYEKLGSTPSRIQVILPPDPNEDKFKIKKPNPLFLLVSIDKAGTLSLNNEKMGIVGDTENLTSKLSEVFKERESNGVFREGTNEVEKTLLVKSSLTLKYGDFIKVIDAVKLAGTQPIEIQIDDLSD